MSEVENAAPEGVAGETFTPDERAYLENRQPDPPAEPEAPEAKAEPEKTEEKKEPRMVDYGALAEERGKRKALEEKVREHELMQARWEERFKAAQRAPQPQKPPPSPDEDIFGAVKHQGAQIDHALRAINGIVQQGQAVNQTQQIANWASSQEAEFKKTNADYDDAFVHLRDSRANELRQLWGLNDYQINLQLQQEWQQLIMRSGQMRENPAKLVYEAAKLRGYAKKAPPPTPEKFDNIEAGQQASKSLSTVGGRSGGSTEETLTDILKMPTEEYEAWKKKNPAKWRRAFGAAN